MSILIAAALAWLGSMWPAIPFFLAVYLIINPMKVVEFLRMIGVDVGESKGQWSAFFELFKKNDPKKVQASDKDGKPLN